VGKSSTLLVSAELQAASSSLMRSSAKLLVALFVWVQVGWLMQIWSSGACSRLKLVLSRQREPLWLDYHALNNVVWLVTSNLASLAVQLD
jgi:hypothetical protein